MTSLDNFSKNVEQFTSDVAQIDGNVADMVNKNKDDFYDKYHYLKPDCEKGLLEQAWDGCKSALKSAAEWCKEHWVMVVTVLVVIAIAIVAVVTFGVAIVAIAAIAGVVSLVLCTADVICMLVTGGNSISDICRENGMGWLGEIFDGISVGCDIVSIVFPAGAAIKSMAKVGVKSFVKGSIQAAKFAFKDTITKVFKSGFKNGVKNLGKILFKTFVFDIDDFSRVNSSGKKVFDIFEHTAPIDIKENTIINNLGLKPDGSFDRFPTAADGYPDGFDGLISNATLDSGTGIDRYGSLYGEFAAPEGTPFNNRALPPESKNAPYNLFKVNEPFDVNSGRTASWFNEPGGGMQYQFNLNKMLTDGKLKIIDYPQITLNGLIHWGGRETSETLAGNEMLLRKQ